MQELCTKDDLILVAYRPVERRLLADQCENDIVLEIASKHKKTPAQIVLNWLLYQNIIPIPKSTNKEHIDENLGALDFELTSNDIDLLNNVK